MIRLFGATVLNSATTVFVYVTWITSFIYLASYTTLARWWQSANGRQMFSLGMLFFGASTLAVLSQVFGQDYGARPWIRFVFWGATAAVTLGLCVTLWRAQGRRRK